MSAKAYHENFIKNVTREMVEVVQLRGNLTQDDLEYLLDKVLKLKDERLKQIAAELVGWGDDERARIETFIAIALEVMKRTRPSVLRDCAMMVEIKYHTKLLSMKDNETSN